MQYKSWAESTELRRDEGRISAQNAARASGSIAASGGGAGVQDASRSAADAIA